MSGVAGADRVKSRQDFKQFITSYKNLIAKFPGFQGMNPSGSYNSDMAKNDFGDIDLVVHIASDKDKAAVKKELQAFFHAQPETVIVPFSSEKHAGKRSYNAGELVSVRYHDDQLGYSAQIDNIIALDQSEATFKQQFLDWPAEKQGLILGLVKIAAIETDPAVLFKQLGISAPAQIEQNQEYEFNLSSVELQLRLVTYDPELLAQGQYKQIDREVIWTSRDFDDIQKLLYQYNLDANFDQLLAQSKKVIKNPRSNARMQGVFGSMITVKSGEVGTAKGANKIAALDKIKSTLGESRSIFRALLEAPQPSTVVFAFGRLQPPTIGHELLVNEVKQVAQQHGCPYVIYVSRTVGKTPAEKLKNPLTVDQKMGYLQKMFPGTNFAPATDVIRTPVEAAQHLNQKYQNLIMVAGGSRAEEFEKLLNDYNGRNYNFNSIKVIKIDRDPDADDASGMSGTKMRQAAAAGDYESFKSGLPGNVDDATAQQLMADVKAGMTPTPKVKKTKEAMLPTSAFAGSDKNKLGVAGQWRNKGPKKNRPAGQGDLVGGAEESIMKEYSDLDNQPEVNNGIDQAQHAGIKIKGPAVADGGEVTDDIIQAIKVLQQTLGNKFGVVTSLNDKFHQKQSKPSDHKTGKGVDFTTVPPPADARQAVALKNRINILLKKAGLPVRYVGDEYFTQRAPNATGGHFHVSMAEGESKAMDQTAKRLTDPNDGKTAKLRAAGDKRREEQLKSRNIAKKNEGVAEGSKNDCPPATQDIKLNLKNRQKAIDEYGYGPLNPDMPNRKFWMAKQEEWNLDSPEEAKQSLCGNCAAFDQRTETLDCIAKGIGSDQGAEDPTIDAGDLGYCRFLKFKCASRRTCDAWVTGGPLTDKQSVATGIQKENNYMEPGEPSKKRGIGSQNYVSRTQAPMGPMEAVKSATARLQSALQREKERRQSRERLGRELLNPKKPVPKQIPVSEDVENSMDVLINKIVINEAISHNKR